MSLPDDGAVKRNLSIGVQTFRLVCEEGYNPGAPSINLSGDRLRDYPDPGTGNLA